MGTRMHVNRDLLNDLNEALKAAHTRFYRLNIGAAGRVSMGDAPGSAWLIWDKLEDGWGIYIETPDGTKPILQASKEHRVAAAGLLAKLQANARETATVEGQHIQTAIQAANAFEPDPVGMR